MTYHFSNLYTVTIHTKLHSNAYFDLTYTIYVGLISSANSEIEAINKFFFYDSKATQLWVHIIQTKEEEMGQWLERIQVLNDRSMHYLVHLKGKYVDGMP